MVVNGGEKQNLRKFIPKYYFGLGQFENHMALFEIWWWMVEKSLKKIIGKKLSLGWFNLRILKLCFGYGGEWWWAGQTQENHWQKNYFGLVQSNDHQALFWIWWWLVVRRETSGKLLKKTTLGWVNFRITWLCFRYGGEWWLETTWRKSLEKKLLSGGSI